MVTGVEKVEIQLFSNTTWSGDIWVTLFDGCSQLSLSLSPAKNWWLLFLVEKEYSFFTNITRLHEKWLTWLGDRDPVPLSHKGRKSSITRIYRHYKLRQVCVTNWSSFVLSKIGEDVVINWCRSVITNWGKCNYKLEQLSQIRANVITKWDSYYKLEQILLQISAVITNCDITRALLCDKNFSKGSLNLK